MNPLKAYLQEKRIKQREAAKSLGVGEVHLSKVLNAHRPMTDAFLGRLARVYPDALPLVLPQVQEHTDACHN